MKTVYDTFAEEFDATRQFAWNEFTEFFPYIKIRCRLLDVGCGNGRFFSSVLEKNVSYTGVDASHNLLLKAKKQYPQAEFIHDAMPSLSLLQERKFDVIVFIASFHHLENREERVRCLLRAKELLAPNGIICMTNWNLFQIKYRKYVYIALLKRIFRGIFGKTIAKKLFSYSGESWNDTFVPFSKNNGEKIMRYYHAFTEEELNTLFESAGLMRIESFLFERASKTQNISQARNVCHIVKKSDE